MTIDTVGIDTVGIDTVGIDTSVPALLVKVGYYPWHHGGVGAIRSLGRLGVPVYAVTEDRWTPAAASRYLREAFVWPTTGREDPALLIEGLIDIGRRIGRPAVLLPTDDEAAVLIAEHPAELADHFLLPAPEPTLPRRLCSKRGLYELCAEFAVPTPAASFPSSPAEVERFAATARFPVMAKNVEAFERLRRPIVAGSTRFDSARQLLEASCHWGDQFQVILQEFLPSETSEDWIVHAYADASSHCLVQFTGRKMRSSPPGAGMTSCGYSVANPALMRLVTQLVKAIGYRGALDMDWRRDVLADEYYLLDFNPRIGAQFRLFETTAGVDVVRAMHLDLTGRDVRPAEQVDDRRYLVENIDLRSWLAARGQEPPTALGRAVGGTELAWLASDDVRPFFVMLARSLLRQMW